MRHNFPTSTADAFDMTLSARVDTNIDILSITAGSLPTDSSAIAADLHSASWVVSSFWMADAVYTVTITARINNNIVPEYPTAQCYMSVVYDSNPGTTYGLPGRSYAIAEFASAPTPIDTTTFSMVVSQTSIASTVLPDVAIEELVTFTVSAYIPEGTTYLAVSVDFDGADRMEIVSSSIALGSSFSCTNGVTAASVLTLSSGPQSTVNDAVVVDFGTCTNAFDNVVTAGDTLVLTFVVSIRDIFPGNRNRGSLLSTATLQFSQFDVANIAQRTASILLDIVEPFLLAEQVTLDAAQPADSADVVCLP